MNAHFFDAGAWRPFARALLAYHGGDREATITVHCDVSEPEVMPVSAFFRGDGELRESDRQALEMARGRILDLGAGVGSIALLLQTMGFAVTAVEVIPEAVQIMRERGIRDVWMGRVEDYQPPEPFDSILLLMNGSTLAGTLSGLPPLLGKLEDLLNPGGQILLDSTDLRPRKGSSRVGAEVPDSAMWAPGEYPGELQYQMEFRGEKGTPFPQLFLDSRTLRSLTAPLGWEVAIAWEDPEGEYLARLSRVV
jgi:SAM-dependent methyltransferase